MILNHSALTVLCLVAAVIAVFEYRFSSAAVYYGPSIEYLMRSNESNGGTNLKKSTGGTINLTDYAPAYSVLVPLVPDKAFVNKTQAVMYFKDFHHGEFFVQAPPEYGVIAIIQILRLFTVTGKSQSCLDYIRFREVSIEANETTASEPTSPKICGTVEQNDDSMQPKGLVGNLTFIARTGRMAIELVMVSNTLQAEWIHRTSTLETVIAAEISFTAFPLQVSLVKVPAHSSSTLLNLTSNSLPKLTMSSSASSSELTLCSLKTGENSPDENDGDEMQEPLRPCCVSEGMPYCIHAQLFCDEIIQCGFECQFAQDESSCSSSEKIDLMKLDMFLNHVQNANVNNGNFVNGSRLSPLRVLDDNPLEVQIIQYFITIIGVIAGIALILGVAWWLMRSYRHFCQPNTLEEDAIEVGNNGTVPSARDLYIARKSVAAIELQNVLEEYRQGRLSMKRTNPNIPVDTEH